MTPRPRLLVLNQYYWPGVEATAYLLSELCDGLSADFDVTVVTGKLRDAPRPMRESRNGVEIVRVPSTSFDRATLLPRAINYSTFLAGAMSAALTTQPPDIVMCMTDPPMLGDVALFVARRFRAPLVIVSQDVFPEVAVQLGRLEHPALIGLLERMIAYYLRRADRVVAIGETMRVRLEAKGTPSNRIAVIQNWADTAAVTPQPRRGSWAKAHGLDSKFVVMHSGNIGQAQDLDTLVGATTLLRDLDDLAVLIVGGGSRLNELKTLARRTDADAVTFLPYQPRETLSESFSAADIHYVGLARGLAGYVVPSRVYGILAAGRPAIVSADAESETARLIQKIGCGFVVPPGRVDLVAETIRDARSGRYDLDAMGALGREYVARELDRTAAVHRYRELLFEVVANRRGSRSRREHARAS
jgi:glycosyltransferase involved in cell wall biosynthesis